jgi:hypothetical protein
MPMQSSAIALSIDHVVAFMQIAWRMRFAYPPYVCMKQECRPGGAISRHTRPVRIFS